MTLYTDEAQRFDRALESLEGATVIAPAGSPEATAVAESTSVIFDHIK